MRNREAWLRRVPGGGGIRALILHSEFVILRCRAAPRVGRGGVPRPAERRELFLPTAGRHDQGPVGAGGAGGGGGVDAGWGERVPVRRRPRRRARRGRDRA